MQNKNTAFPPVHYIRATIKRDETTPVEGLPSANKKAIGRLQIATTPARWLGKDAYCYFFDTGEIEVREDQEPKEYDVLVANLVIPGGVKLRCFNEDFPPLQPAVDPNHDHHKHANWAINAPFAFHIYPGAKKALESFFNTAMTKGRLTCAYPATSWENVPDFSFEKEMEPFGTLYLVPLILFNGITCYFGTYRMEELRAWGNFGPLIPGKYVAINGPITLDEELQVLITYSAKPV